MKAFAFPPFLQKVCLSKRIIGERVVGVDSVIKFV